MHFWKTKLSIDVTSGGISICFNDEQLRKALFLIDFTELGIDIFSKEVQPEKAKQSIRVTDEGIITCVNNEQDSKKLFIIEVTEEGIENLVNDKQL